MITEEYRRKTKSALESMAILDRGDGPSKVILEDTTQGEERG